MSITITGASGNITLPNMDFGDSERIKLNTKYTMTMSGKTYSYKVMPNYRSLLLKFSKLEPSDVGNFLQFLEDTDSEQVVITGLNDLTFTGVLLMSTYELATTNLRTGQTPSTSSVIDQVLHTVTIQFEGSAT
ncbi:MAG: hypothetical protein M0R80_26270 [Proteobacteria bacterium]|jgi:hypothetical protein|nr:hypothetical protein [Pseudomonadota bacterium]